MIRKGEETVGVYLELFRSIKGEHKNSHTGQIPENGDNV